MICTPDISEAVLHIMINIYIFSLPTGRQSESSEKVRAHRRSRGSSYSCIE